MFVNNSNGFMNRKFKLSGNFEHGSSACIVSGADMS